MWFFLLQVIVPFLVMVPVLVPVSILVPVPVPDQTWSLSLVPVLVLPKLVAYQLHGSMVTNEIKLTKGLIVTRFLALFRPFFGTQRIYDQKTSKNWTISWLSSPFNHMPIIKYLEHFKILNNEANIAFLKIICKGGKKTVLVNQEIYILHLFYVQLNILGKNPP